jgi:hypothetical protein
VAALTRSLAAGAVLCSSLSALGYPALGPGGGILITLWPAVIAALYTYTHHLLPCIITHVLNDGFSSIVMPQLFFRRGWGLEGTSLRFCKF